MFIGREAEKNELPFRYNKMGRWFGKTTVRDEQSENGLRVAETEIDLLAIGRDSKEYLVGECKFKKLPFRYSDYLDTKAKLTSLKENAKFHYVLFSESGFDEKIVNEARNGILSLYGLKEIVNYK